MSILPINRDNDGGQRALSYRKNKKRFLTGLSEVRVWRCFGNGEPLLERIPRVPD